VQTTFMSGGTPLVTQSGLEVKPGSDGQYNLKNPWQSANEIELRNVTFRGGNGAAMTVDNFGDPNSGGEWTNLSSMDVTSGRVHVERAGEKPVGANGTVDSLSIRDPEFAANKQQVDLVATSGGSWDLYINQTGLSSGTGLVAQDAETKSILDGAAVGNQGKVHFTDMPQSSARKINIETAVTKLKIYNESSPSELVDNAVIRVRAITDNEVIEREAGNGELFLGGLPRDERLVITAADSDNSDYIYRRITIPSAQQQAEIYLINGTSNVDRSDVEFTINDDSGQFPAGDARFLIEKPIKKDFDGDGINETQYQVISGDIIGNSRAYPATLLTDNRYRLRAINSDGDERVLGSYVVRRSAAPTISIGRVVLDGVEEEGYAADLSVLLRDANGDGTDEEFVQVQYKDEDNRT